MPAEDEKERNLLSCIENLIVYVRKTTARTDAVAPFYKSDPQAEVPCRDSRLECLFNPLLNSGDCLLRDFSVSLKRYERNSYPKGAFDVLHDEVQNLLWKLNDLCPSESFMLAMIHISDFRNYLDGCRSLEATLRHEDSIEFAMRTLRNRLDTLTLLLHNLSDKLIHQHQSQYGTRTTGKRRHSGARPKFTVRQEQEIVDFVERPDFDTGRELCGRTCYAVSLAAKEWSKLKHPSGMPRTEAEFRTAYRTIKRRACRR